MQWLILLSTVLLASALAVAFYLYRFGAATLPLKPSQPTLLLVGPSSAGKTCLFQKLVHDKRNTPTYTSQRPNAAQMGLESGKRIRVVDVPGHSKLFGQFKTFPATSIAFVLDSSTISKNVDHVARNLLEVLTFARTKNVAEVAIFANKSDFFTSISTDRISELIETEVEQIRRQKDGVQMDSIEERSEDEEDEWLQDIAGSFILRDHCSMYSGSVLKDDINAWQDWIEASFA